MAYDFKGLKGKIKEASDWLTKEFSGIRTGRATPALLDSVRFESYGTMTPVSQAGSITVDDPRSLRVTPWDSSQIKNIEKAITVANLGVGVSVDEKSIRVSFPELTSERRQSIVKLANDKREEARRRLRSARDDTWSDIQKKHKEGAMGEDDKFRAKDEMEKHIGEGNKQLDALFDRKQKEIES